MSSKKQLKETIRQLTSNNLIVVCHNTNDLETNKFPSTFQNIRNFLRNINHTNILLLSIPFRYDLPDPHIINKEISTLNKKLQRLVKLLPNTRFMDFADDRRLFTKHGLHRNKLGEKPSYLSDSLSYPHRFYHTNSPTIPLGWYEPNNDVKPLSDTMQTKSLNRNSNGSKKMPVTRTNNFLWIT